MRNNDVFPHKFVELIPKTLDERVLYVSVEHAVAVHLCACGCARKVVTPLAPIHWKLLFDGRSVSLRPSIGNHAFPCKSHYWLEEGRVRWSYEMSDEDVADVRAFAKRTQQQFYGNERIKPEAPTQPERAPTTKGMQATKSRSWWRRLLGGDESPT